MWGNLLSGLIGSVLGSVLGVLGAYYLAVKTLIKSRENERTLIREQASVDSAGEIAVVLLLFKDSLDGLAHEAGGLTAEDDVAIDQNTASILWPAMADLRRKVTVHEPMLPQEVVKEVRNTLAAMREVFGPVAKLSMAKGQLIEIRQLIRSATEKLSEFRRGAYLG